MIDLEFKSQKLGLRKAEVVDLEPLAHKVNNVNLAICALLQNNLIERETKVIISSGFSSGECGDDQNKSSAIEDSSRSIPFYFSI